MNLFQFLRKNKQDDAATEGAYRSRAEEESNAVRTRGKRSAGSHSNPVDPVLPEKKRARRRLIGAVALVLAAVIGLPMVLDTEPKPLADDIAIQIPSMDKPARSSASHQTATPAKASADHSSEASSSTSEAASAKVVVPAPVNDSARQAVADAGQVNSPETKPETKSAPKPQKQAEKRDDSERARAILEGKAEPKAESKAADSKAGAEKKSGQYLVQVAALVSQEKVNELQGKLKSAGIASHTQKVTTQTGERIRVRIGPFTGKDEADKMRAKLQKIGLNGTLVPA